MASIARTKVMVSGLPGKMATAFARAAQKDERVWLVNHAFTGEEVKDDYIEINGQRITLIRPSERDRGKYIFSMVPGYRETIIIDFTEPASINGNVDFYVRNGLYFVAGTTGGDTEKMRKDIAESDISAVIAPNMAIPIVAITDAIEQMAERFPGSCRGSKFIGTESHQWWKKDPSGTMKKLIQSFNKLGAEASLFDIRSIRNKEEQLSMGVPEEFLDAHAYHDYRLVFEDAGVELRFGHDVNGREAYALGAIEAVVYLDRKRISGDVGKVYGMTDVIKNL
jgi:4-hydroxy-tetrahydrodipicolinate reductase